MAIENINRPGYLPEPTDARPQQTKTSQEASSVLAADMKQDTVLSEKVAEASKAPEPAKSQITDEVVNELNEAILGVRRELRFSIDEESGRAIVQVMDSETGEMIRQLPPDEVLAVSRHIREVLESSQSSSVGGSSAEGAVGMFFQSTA